VIARRRFAWPHKTVYQNAMIIDRAAGGG
jgi:hypothetical protein